MVVESCEETFGEMNFIRDRAPANRTPRIDTPCGMTRTRHITGRTQPNFVRHEVHTQSPTNVSLNSVASFFSLGNKPRKQ